MECVSTVVVGTGEVGGIWLDISTILRCGAAGGPYVWFLCVVYVSLHLEEAEYIPPQSGSQFDGKSAKEDYG